jgi:hypothetical protein
MRYRTLAVVTLVIIASLTILMAAPPNADARKRFGPGAVFGILTGPMRMLAPPFAGRRAYRHRDSRSYARPSEPEPRAPADARAAPPVDTRTAPPVGARTAVAAGAAAATAAVMPAAFNGYEDILGYALWPSDYADKFWARGYGDVMRSVMAPAAATARNIGPGNADASMCNPQAKQRASAPIVRIEQTLTLTDAQRGKLQDLRKAVDEAVERGKAACHDKLPQTPSDRLSAMMDGLWAMRDADILFRTPLDQFYRSLTDEQKAKLAGKVPDTTTGGPQVANQVCGQAANDMPINEIVQSVQPNAEQRESLGMVQGMSADLSKYLASACPQETPATPVDRLDAAGNRVNAMLYAAMNLGPVLNGFYFQLTDEQKKKFDSMGR